METRFLESRERVRHGKTREKQIADALKEQAGLNLQDASDSEDKEQKIDRWLISNGKKTAVQIKYRETGDDLLVEVFDKWNGWDNQNNKIGRDMIGDARLYAVLRMDKKTVVLVKTNTLKHIVNDMLQAAKTIGWTVDNGDKNKSLQYSRAGGRCELRVQRDPRDGRAKMVAYIPANVLTFEGQAEVYRINLPRKWQD